ncbi:Uncharacterised protein g3304 [Pycnogonum litorale]
MTAASDEKTLKYRKQTTTGNSSAIEDLIEMSTISIDHLEMLQMLNTLKQNLLEMSVEIAMFQVDLATAIDPVVSKSLSHALAESEECFRVIKQNRVCD